MYFMTIPFSFSASNIRPSDMIAGMPALSAVGGMTHNIQRVFQHDLGFSSFTVMAFSLVYFNLDAQDSAPKRPMQGLKDGKPTLPGLMDIRRGFGEAAVVLYFDVPDLFEHKDFAELMGSKDGELQIKNLLDMHIRFAGGEVLTGTMGEYGTHEFKTSVFQRWDDVLTKMMQAYPTQGLLLQDMSQTLIEKAQAEGTTALEAMHALLLASQVERYERYAKPRARQVTATTAVATTQLSAADQSVPVMDELVMDDDFFRQELNSQVDRTRQVMMANNDIAPDAEDLSAHYVGTLLPAAVGFHEICEPRGQQYFVEQVLGLVKARILPSVKLDITQARADWQTHFWRWEHLDEHRLHRAVTFSN
jgi:hypothetical protein